MDFIFKLLSPAQLGSLVRTMVTPTVVGGVAYAVGKGWISKEGSGELTSLIILVLVQAGASAWGVQSHTVASQVANIRDAEPATLLQAVVEAVPEVKKIETTPALAAATPSDKIVAKA